MHIYSSKKITTARIKKCYVLSCFCLIVLSQFNANAQNPPYITYNEQNGLTTSVIYGLFQDSEDNIWFCTNAGAVKFNGNKLTTYEKKDGMPGNEVFKIFEDSRHRLWFMTLNGQISYYYKDKVYNTADHPIFSQLKINSFISDIMEDDEHNIRIIPDKGSIWNISADLISIKEIPSKLHNGVFFRYNHSDYLASQDGIYSMNNMSLIIQSPAASLHPFLVERHCFSEGIVYSGINKDLNVFDLQNKNVKVFKTPGLPFVLNSIVKIDSTLFICSGNGLNLYASNTLKETGSYFSGANVSHVLKDKEGSLWVSTLNEGVKYIPNMQIRFLQSADLFQGNKILKLNGIGNYVIIGQSNSKVSYYKKGVLKPISPPYESKGEGLTFSINTTADSSFYISTQAGLTVISEDKKPLYFRDIIFSAIIPADKDSFYISTPTAIGKFSKPINVMDFFDRKMFFDSIRMEALIYDDKDSILYACSKRGFFTYKNKKKIDNKLTFLQGKSFTDMDRNSKGLFIASTLGDGIFFFSNDHIIQVKDKDGLSNNMCSSIFLQNDSTVWVTTFNGLNKIFFCNQEGVFKFRIKRYYRNDGLPANYLNDIYIYADTIWLAANNGLTVTSETDLGNNSSYRPRITIDAFKVNNQYKTVIPGQSIRLARSDNNIVLEFNCSTFKNAGSLNYKYRLSGQSNNWIETKNNQVDFTGLSHGNYTFEVMANSLNGDWESDIARFSFSIKPAYFETAWFWILISIAAALIILALILFQFRRVKNKFALKQKIINYEKELLELEQQALRLQMNPHFIFNALNSIQHSILNGKKDEAYNHLELFSSLIRGILENSKHKYISLEDEIEILKIYIQIEAARFDDKFKHELIIDPAIDTSCISIPPMLIQPFVENSIWHGLIPKKDGEKKLILSFTGYGSTIVCKVDDNGVGRNHLKLEKNTKNKTQLGTTLTLNRLANINLLEKSNKYSIEILDKEDEGGTTVVITIQV